MKKFLLTAIAVTATFIMAGCEQFSTSYERIDHGEFRMLNFIYEPADAAPGDSVTLTAVFAGKHVDDLDKYLTWHISFNVIRDLFGSTTVVDSTRLEPIARRIDTVFSPNTQTVKFKFEIPKDIVRKSASIPDKWVDMLPLNMRDNIPEEFAALTKNQIVDTIEALAAQAAVKLPPVPPHAIIDSRTIAKSVDNKSYVNPLYVNPNPVFINPVTLQFFTVPFRVSVKINDPSNKHPHAIRSNQTVRYNSKFKLVEFMGNAIPVNNNPEVDSVVLYEVKGEDVNNINDKNILDLEIIRLDGVKNPVITFKKGYSYFLSAFTTSSFDWTTTMYGNRMIEDHYIYRQFQLSEKDIDGLHHSDYMGINNMNGKITPPASKKITDFVFWITVQDEVINERMRPDGAALVEVSGKFDYE